MTETKLAHKIVVDHDRHEILIDGVPLPVMIADEPTVTYVDGLWSVSVDILAEDVEQIRTLLAAQKRILSDLDAEFGELS